MSNATKTAKRSDFKKYFQFMWRSLNIQASWNYERQMNMGFCTASLPRWTSCTPTRTTPSSWRTKGSLRA